MSLAVFLVFFFSTFLISATPGPNMLLAFQQGLNYGVRYTIWILGGLSFGLFILLLSALLGIDIVSRQFPWLLIVIKGGGALYLVYLGIQAWLHASDSVGFDISSKSVAAKLLKTPWQRFRRGVWVSLSNPKAILFFAAFFPKFINFNAPLLPQYALLTLGFFASETSWQIAYTVGGKKLANWFGSGSRLLWLNRICGIIFIFIAVAMFWEVVVDIV